MPKEIHFDYAAKQLLQTGVNKVADAVGSTMGPGGKTVVISNYKSVPPFYTKDGVTVAGSIQLKDELENIGAQMVRQASKKTADDAGDGTTQTVVLAQSLIDSGLKSVKLGANPQEVKSGMDKAIGVVINDLSSMSNIIGDSNETIRKIATVSANNDKMIGDLIADAYSKIGNDNNSMLQIEESGIIDTTIEIAKGFEIDRGYMSPHFVNKKDKMEVQHASPLFLICDYTISNMNELAPVFNDLVANGIQSHAVIIIAHDFEGETFSSMILNHIKGNIKCCLVKAPNTYRPESLDDIACVTGGVVIRDSAGLKMENATVKHLGKAGSVIISERKMTIIGGESSPVDFEEHKKGMKIQMEEMKDEKLKEVWKKRLAMISGCIGIIKVGGSTDLEMKERKDRVDDACRAVRSAIEEGFVAGGGIALLRCLNSVDKMKDSSELIGDEVVGIEIVKKAMLSPFAKMLDNAGIEKIKMSRWDRFLIWAGHKESIMSKTINLDSEEWGYNIRDREYVNMLEMGIIDPTKVIRCALLNAASVASAVITSDCLVVEVD